VLIRLRAQPQLTDSGRPGAQIYAYGISLRTLRCSTADMVDVLRSLRFLFVVFDVRIWLLYAFPRLTLPVLVSVKRFAAALFVLIFGMEVTSPDVVSVTLFF
jgi:hypothetical protein